MGGRGAGVRGAMPPLLPLPPRQLLQLAPSFPPPNRRHARGSSRSLHVDLGEVACKAGGGISRPGSRRQGS